MKPRIRIINESFKHSQGGSFGAGDLNIHPTHFEWNWSDEKAGDIVVITEECMDAVDSCKELVKILLIIEPEQISPEPYRRIREPRMYSKFTHILTYNQSLLKLNKEKFMPFFFGGCWIMPDQRGIHVKPKNISIIASGKTNTIGQRMRHEAISQFAKDYKIDVYGRGYAPVENKITALEDYKFSIVIENDLEGGIISEKLIDCLQTGTIPLYYGHPSWADHFNMHGIYPFANLDELKSLLIKIQYGAINYDSRMDAVNENLKLSSAYVLPEDRIWNQLLKGIYEMIN